jgi:uracil-DNA glycosylase family 4
MNSEPLKSTPARNLCDWDSLNSEIANCRLCPRLVAWREEVAITRRRAFRDQVYWGKPVPGFGDYQARILVVGLAPGAHGSNRTGRMFTGDASGEFLYSALQRAGYANQAESTSRQDGLMLNDMFITAVCRCAPPDNKPEKDEIVNCQPFLLAERHLLTRMEGVVALGKLAFDRILAIYRAEGHSLPGLQFGHDVFYPLAGGLPWLLASYHPSRQNTQTGRLTPVMFDRIWQKCRSMLDNPISTMFA